MQVLLAGDQPAVFLQKAMDPPKPEAVATATHNLQELGAVVAAPDVPKGGAGECEPTPLGFHLAHISVEARVAKMLVRNAPMESNPAQFASRHSCAFETRGAAVGGLSVVCAARCSVASLACWTR